jgi:hypothetical protein
VINGHESAMKPTTTGIPQGSPVSPILFAIYISGIFEEIEEEVLGSTGLSFVDDISWLAVGKDVTEIINILTACAKAAKAWARRNAVEFDVAKTEAVIFTRNKIRTAMTINLEDSIQIKYNKGATRWLGFWLDSALNFKDHHSKRMAKAYQMENQIKRLHMKFGMTPTNVRQIMIATVQSSALFGSEIWWHNQKNKAADIQKMLNIIDPYVPPRKASMARVPQNTDAILAVHNDFGDLAAQLKNLTALLNIVSIDSEPLTYKEAMASPDRDQWKEAMKREWRALIANKTFETFQNQGAYRLLSRSR